MSVDAGRDRFISNPEEERNLRDPEAPGTHGEGDPVRGSEVLHRGTASRDTAGGASTRATLKHVISKGDTLSEIADRYQVSLGSLRRENDIRSENHIRIGQVLVIPDT